MKTKWPGSEVELGKVVVAWLRERGYVVYQEVGDTDIVAVLGPLVWIVELKLHFGFDVIGQAVSAKEKAHMASIAVPHIRYSPIGFARPALLAFGIGAIEVFAPNTPPDYLEMARVAVPIPAPMNRHAAGARRFRESLHPAQMDAALAGSPGNRLKVTPFKATCLRLTEYVAAHPGAPIQEVLENCPTHYINPKNARTAIAKWIRAGLIRDIRLKRESGVTRLFPNVGAGAW